MVRGCAFAQLYTGLPILVVGVLDRDVSVAQVRVIAVCGTLPPCPSFLLTATLVLRFVFTQAFAFPYLYHDGLVGRLLNRRVFWSWIVEAVAQACVIYLVIWASLPHGDKDGATLYIFMLGSVAFACYFLTATMRLVIEVNNHDLLFRGSIVVSWVLYVATAFLYDWMDTDNIRGGTARLWGTWQVCVCVCVCVCVVFFGVVVCVLRLFLSLSTPYVQVRAADSVYGGVFVVFCSSTSPSSSPRQLR